MLKYTVVAPHSRALNERIFLTIGPGTPIVAGQGRINSAKKNIYF